jgi:hypothetical protein
MTKTLKEHAQLAWDVQDACNGSGVARALVRWFDDFEAAAGAGSTDARNQHPITVLYVDKLAHLAGCQALGDDTVMRAYTEVRKLTEES